jgi:hypothetical protein
LRRGKMASCALFVGRFERPEARPGRQWASGRSRALGMRPKAGLAAAGCQSSESFGNAPICWGKPHFWVAPAQRSEGFPKAQALGPPPPRALAKTRRSHERFLLKASSFWPKNPVCPLNSPKNRRLRAALLAVRLRGPLVVLPESGS